MLLVFGFFLCCCSALNLPYLFLFYLFCTCLLKYKNILHLGATLDILFIDLFIDDYTCNAVVHLTRSHDMQSMWGHQGDQVVARQW